MVVLDEIWKLNQQKSGADQQQTGSEVKSVEIYPEILMQRMGHFENLQEVFRDQLKDYPAVMSVWYEDLLENPEEQFNQIQKFLGVSPKPIHSLLSRQDRDPLKRLLLNYDDVEVLFRGSKWNAFLD